MMYWSKITHQYEDDGNYGVNLDKADNVENASQFNNMSPEEILNSFKGSSIKASGHKNVFKNVSHETIVDYFKTEPVIKINISSGSSYKRDYSQEIRNLEDDIIALKVYLQGQAMGINDPFF
jgi:hypothetical protein